MPLLVRLISPARNALLLLGSCQESVPGMKVSYICLAYSSAAVVSGVLMTTLFLSSTILPPCDQSSQGVHEFASPVAWPRSKPGDVPFFLRAWQSFSKPPVGFVNSYKPTCVKGQTGV